MLKGFFSVASVSASGESLSLYTDDRDSPITYSGDIKSDEIVSWALSNLDKVIADRSAEAASLKAFQ